MGQETSELALRGFDLLGNYALYDSLAMQWQCCCPSPVLSCCSSLLFLHAVIPGCDFLLFFTAVLFPCHYCLLDKRLCNAPIFSSLITAHPAVITSLLLNAFPMYRMLNACMLDCRLSLLFPTLALMYFFPSCLSMPLHSRGNHRYLPLTSLRS